MPGASPRLDARLLEVLHEVLDKEADASHLFRAAELLLPQAVRNDRAREAVSLDLLCADALVTFGCELAAEHPDGLEAQLRAAAERLSEVGE